MIGYPRPLRVALDSRWDLIEVTSYGDSTPVYVKGMCRHTEIVDVGSIFGEVIAQLCITCDMRIGDD